MSTTTEQHRSSEAEDRLRSLVRTALDQAGITQASAAKQLDLSPKHVSQLLTGRIHLSLYWGERFLTLCGTSLQITAAPCGDDADQEDAEPIPESETAQPPDAFRWAQEIWSANAGATIHVPGTADDGSQTNVTVAADDARALAAMLLDRFGERLDVPVPWHAFDKLLRVAQYVSIGRSAVDVRYPDSTARFALGALDDAGLLPGAGQESPDVVHACPGPGSGITPCCGRTPFKLPREERITTVTDDVTCNATPAAIRVPATHPEATRVS